MVSCGRLNGQLLSVRYTFLYRIVSYRTFLNIVGLYVYSKFTLEKPGDVSSNSEGIEGTCPKYVTLGMHII